MKTINQNMNVNDTYNNHSRNTTSGLNKYILIACMLPIFASCNYMDKMANLTEDNLKLHKELQDKSNAVNYFTKSYAEIENNLTNIKVKQHLITVNMSNESTLKPDIKERIKADINQIDMLLTENKKAIADLENKLAKSDAITAGMDKMVKNLYARMDEKQREYNSLRGQLIAANVLIQDYKDKVYNQGIENESQANIIEFQKSKMNTAYYVTGTYKELKQDGILTKKGGIIGIASTKALKDNFDKTYFNKIEIDKLKEIQIDANKVSIITNHAPDSYKIEKVDGELDKLVITNPEKFWETSKYLVVMAK